MSIAVAITVAVAITLPVTVAVLLLFYLTVIQHDTHILEFDVLIQAFQFGQLTDV